MQGKPSQEGTQSTTARRLRKKPKGSCNGGLRAGENFTEQTAPAGKKAGRGTRRQNGATVAPRNADPAKPRRQEARENNITKMQQRSENHPRESSEHGEKEGAPG